MVLNELKWAQNGLLLIKLGILYQTIQQMEIKWAQMASFNIRQNISFTLKLLAHSVTLQPGQTFSTHIYYYYFFHNEFALE